jgi:hypothetical protein
MIEINTLQKQTPLFAKNIQRKKQKSVIFVSQAVDI